MDELLEPDRSEADVPSARGQAPAFPAAGGSLIHTTSLCGDIVFRPLLARQSLAAKIPFQTRIGQADRKIARGEFGASLFGRTPHKDQPGRALPS